MAAGGWLVAEELARRPLGRTGLNVTVVGFGALELRGEPRGRPVDEADASHLLNAVLDAGINLIDTSIDYGLSEERIGRHIAHRRDEYILASKCGCPLDVDPRVVSGSTPHDFSEKNIRAGVEQSLRRLRTDRLDLLQVHASPPVSALAEHRTIETMLALREEGKVRFLGMSGVLPHLQDHIALDAFDVFQVPYSVVAPRHAAAVQRAGEAGAGVVVRGAVARGAVGGGGSLRGGDALRSVWDRAQLAELAEEGATAAELMLRYVLGHPHVSTVIIGTLNPDHLAANIAAIQRGPLPVAVHDDASRRVAGVLQQDSETTIS